MATIPARTATGRRYQTEASSATSVGIASGLTAVVSKRRAM
jgi:hypothetical protein